MQQVLRFAQDDNSYIGYALLMFQNLKQPVGDHLISLRLQVRDADVKRTLLIVQHIAQVMEIGTLDFAAPLVHGLIGEPQVAEFLVFQLQDLLFVGRLFLMSDGEIGIPRKHRAKTILFRQ